MATAQRVNGLLSPPATEKAASVASPPRVVLAGKTGRILCVADIRGDHHELNRLIPGEARLTRAWRESKEVVGLRGNPKDRHPRSSQVRRPEHEATAVIHTGDFGFINEDSLNRISDNVLRHLIQYSPLLPPATRNHLLSIPADAPRADLIKALNDSSTHFPLSQFPHLLSGAITFPVPVFTVWGLIEDVRVLEKFRTGEYEVRNLSVIDEATTRLIEVSGVKLRLFGLGGAVALHKLFDSGDGLGTIAGGEGTMWTTALQIGELIDSAQRVYDPSETRLLVSSAPISRHGILAQLAHTIKADLTISGGLHFRYPVSFNDYSIHADFGLYRDKFILARDSFSEVYNAVKDKVENSMNPDQKLLLRKTLSATQLVPEPPKNEQDEQFWTNQWHWVLSDASAGHLVLSVTDSRISMESKSQGLNFAHRSSSTSAPPSAPVSVKANAIQPVRPAGIAESSAFPAVGGIPPIGQNRSLPDAPGALSKPGIGGPFVRPTAGGNFRPPTQPAQTTPSKPPGVATPVGPAARPGPNAGLPAPQSIPSKPAAQVSRNPRGPGGLAGQALAAAGATREQKPESRPAHNRQAESRGSVAAATKTPAASATNGKASPGPASETRPAKPEQKKPTSAANGADVNGDKVKNKEKTKDTEKTDEDEEKPTTPVEGDSKPQPKKPSLYLKGLPVPTKDEDLRKMFGEHASKITHIKIVFDRIKGQSKDFGYVDFATDEDMKAALEANTGKIGDKTVEVSISNPPTSRFASERPGTRGAPGGRGGRGSFRGSSGGRGRGGLHGGNGGSREGVSKDNGGEKEGVNGGGGPAAASKKEGGEDGKKE